LLVREGEPSLVLAFVKVDQVEVAAITAACGR
jgi:hypothetical protein